jgi:hypothetical protein
MLRCDILSTDSTTADGKSSRFEKAATARRVYTHFGVLKLCPNAGNGGYDI